MNKKVNERDRFKFRFWNNRTEQYEDIYCCSSAGFLVEFVNPEQCTGLKDRKGKLIYEGDVLCASVVDWKNKEKWNCGRIKTLWTVEYKNFSNQCGFMVYGENRKFHKPLTFNTIYNAEAVVVGNIHEGKENEEYNLA